MYVSQVLPGDFDGDGLQDLMLVGYWPWAVAIAKGLGSLEFGEPRALQLPGVAHSISDALHAVCADLDADGRAEIALNLPKRGATAVIGADSNGWPRVEGWLPTPGTVGCHQARDLGNDGSVDVVYLARDDMSGCSLWSFQQQTSGGFGIAQLLEQLPVPWIPGIWPPSKQERWGSRPSWLQLVDLDGDARLDIVARRQQYSSWPFIPLGSEIAIWHRLPDGGWEPPFEKRIPWPSVEGPGPIDLDRDGRPELAFRLPDTTGLQIWRLQDGLPTSKPECYTATGQALADVDHDGLPDAVGCTWNGLVTYHHRDLAGR